MGEGAPHGCAGRRPGLALKDHGMGRTLKGLCVGDPRMVLHAWPLATKTLQGPSCAMVLQGQAPSTIVGRTLWARTSLTPQPMATWTLGCGRRSSALRGAYLLPDAGEGEPLLQLT